jgi:predicted ATP-dependent endonuclease of OLD family
MKISTVRIANWKSFADSGVVKLGDINVIVGRNNGGKSAFLRAVHLMQSGAPVASGDVRLGAAEGDVTLELVSDNLGADVQRHYPQQQSISDLRSATLVIRFSRQGDNINLAAHALDVELNGSRNSFSVGAVVAEEPGNFIYNYLSKRKVQAFDQIVDRQRTRAVAPDLRHLVSKVARLANQDYERADEYAELCRKVLNLRISTHPAQNGQQAGISVGRFDTISIEAMGEGVSSMLGLIADLCVAENCLFLIEEPENDVHPESLKALLAAIVAKSSSNQFLITTHSNIVVRHLAAAPNSRLFEVTVSDPSSAEPPTSRIRDVGSAPEDRIEVLRQLGYELYDFDLHDGWLILEESSAEAVVHCLIPLFTPRLARVRTVSAGGVDRVGPMFEDFKRLFLFAHLERHYNKRAWVIVDGDEIGKRVVAKLQAGYKDWPSGHFCTWSEENFEKYYPAEFADRVAEVLAMPHGQHKQQAKKKLVEEVKAWVDEQPEGVVRAAFESSAGEVIEALREIERKLFERDANAKVAGGEVAR